MVWSGIYIACDTGYFELCIVFETTLAFQKFSLHSRGFGKFTIFRTGINKRTFSKSYSWFIAWQSKTNSVSSRVWLAYWLYTQLFNMNVLTQAQLLPIFYTLSSKRSLFSRVLLLSHRVKIASNRSSQTPSQIDFLLSVCIK